MRMGHENMRNTCIRRELAENFFEMSAIGWTWINNGDLVCTKQVGVRAPIGHGGRVWRNNAPEVVAQRGYALWLRMCQIRFPLFCGAHRVWSCCPG